MSTSAKKKKSKPGKKAPAPKTKAKVTKAKKVAKVAAVEKPKKVAKPKAEKAERKEAPQKPVVKAKPLELGPAPSAVIESRHLDSMRSRPGRGFSFRELSSAGVEFNVAKREGLSLDIRRRSVVEGNVEALKEWLKTSVAAKPAAEPVAVAAVSNKK